jgi:hypothetical protein
VTTQSAQTATLVARISIVFFFMARSSIYLTTLFAVGFQMSQDITFRQSLRRNERPPGPPRPTKLVVFASMEKPMVASASREKEEVMFRLRGRDWIILTAFIIAGAIGYVVYSKWAEEGLRRTEADMKSNLPLRVDLNTTLVDVKYERTHSTYWYVIDKPDQFDPQETARQVQIGVCTNAENSSTMKKEGFSYEYHYRTKDGLALTDFKITSCE